jgi:hypothetical protein
VSEWASERASERINGWYPTENLPPVLSFISISTNLMV